MICDVFDFFMQDAHLAERRTEGPMQLNSIASHWLTFYFGRPKP